MGWVRLDDRITENPKMDAVGPIGSWMHVCAIAYCNRQLTDGLFPQRMVQRLGAFDWLDPETAGMPAALVQAGLWHGPGHSCGQCPAVRPGHYVVHGYAEFQPSRADVEARREKLSEFGKAGARKRWGGKGQVNDPTHETGMAEPMADAIASGNAPNPTQPNPVASKEAPSSKSDLYEAVLTVCNVDPDQVTKTARKPYDKAVAELATLGATPDDVMEHAMAYRKQWPEAALTPTALTRRWAECAGSSTHNERVLAQFAAGGAS